MAIDYSNGDWDALLGIIEEIISRKTLHYVAAYGVDIRSRVRIARGDVTGAIQDAARTLEVGRAAKDPQRLLPALACTAFTLLRVGRIDECTSHVDELLGLDPFNARIPHVVDPVLDLAWILTALGRADEYVRLASAVRMPTRWHEAGLAFARGDLERSADVCVEIGVLPNEAYTRLRAAENLFAEGRADAAEVQLTKSLDFYRSVRATAYITEGERLRASHHTTDAAEGT
jgi:hypothetical protein